MENVIQSMQNNSQNKYNYASKKKVKDDSTNAKTSDNTWDLLKESYEPSQKIDEIQSSKDKTANGVRTAKSSSKPEMELSDRAKKLLEKLKDKYGNMDFFIASYSSDEEAQHYLRQGTKEYSVLIDPETLEQMAADENVCKNYEDILSGAGDRLQELKDKLGKDADAVKNFGISIASDGKVSYFAELDRITESRNNQVERAKESRTEKKEAAKKKEKAKERRERFTVKADSIDELVKQIQEKKSEKTDENNKVGNEFDLSV